jgi:hypothetical protein
MVTATNCVVDVALNIGTAIFSFAAACFWLASAVVKTPKLRNDYLGLIENPQAILAALKLSAKRNQAAAICAAISALLFAVVVARGLC